MGLRFLEDFLKLAETGNFSRAAEERNVTQPAFSRRIKSLENYVGVPLIDRRTYPTSLTPAGVAFRDAALDMVRSLHEARRRAREAAAVDLTLVRVAALHSIAIHYYPLHYRVLQQHVGPFTVHMTCDSMHNCVQSFVEGTSQYLAVFSNPAVPIFVSASNHPFLVVEQDRLIPVCAPATDGSPRYTLPGKPSAPRPYLCYGPSAYLGKLLDELLGRETHQASLSVVYQDDVAEALKSMAVAGYGIAWLPRRTMMNELAARRLVQCGDERWVLPLDVRVYHKQGFSDVVRTALTSVAAARAAEDATAATTRSPAPATTR
jgi:DNA-binding transcriptional LysR family regulator